MAFLFIWAAVVVYSIDSVRYAKSMAISVPGEAKVACGVDEIS